MAQDYKMKYTELRSRFVSSLDVAFRLGYQKGQQDSQVQQLQQQQEQQQQQLAMQQQQLMQQQNAAQQAPPQEQEGSGYMEQGASQFEQQAQDLQQQGVSEIEQGIKELEELLNKGEGNPSSMKAILGIFNGSLNKINQSQSLKKTEHLKLMNEGKEIFKQAAVRHNESIQKFSEETHSIQKRIVNDILKKWEDEEKEVSKDIMGTLKVEGKVK